MGWKPRRLGANSSSSSALRAGCARRDGKPIALGYHTGHWEIGLLVQAAAEEFRG